MKRPGKLRRSVLAGASLLATAGIAVVATQQPAAAAERVRLDLYAASEECIYYGRIWTTDGDSPYGDWHYTCPSESGKYRLWVYR